MIPQPIETAPKDGTPILVFYEVATVWIAHIAHWDDGELWDLSGFDSREECRGWWSYVCNSVSQEKLEGLSGPTCWMPLPDLAKLGGDDAQMD